VHRPRTDTDVEETLSALSDLVHQGKVRISRRTSASSMPLSSSPRLADEPGITLLQLAIVFRPQSSCHRRADHRAAHHGAP